MEFAGETEQKLLEDRNPCGSSSDEIVDKNILTLKLRGMSPMLKGCVKQYRSTKSQSLNSN